MSNKKGGNKKYGLLQEKKGEVIKWSRVNVDLWGPKSVNNGEYTYQVHVMTMVDPVTGWFELAPLYGAPTAFRAQQRQYLASKISKTTGDWIRQWRRIHGRVQRAM